MDPIKTFEVPTPVKLGLGWAATVLCYIYCDYFALYVPGKLQGILDGHGPFGPVTGASLLGAGILLIVPGVMTFLSVVLPSAASRISNLVFGVLYTILMLALAMGVQWYFYKLFALVEASLTAAIFWMAWKWPRTHGASRSTV